MMRQVCNQQGHLNIPLRKIVFFTAMLSFVFTVVYRMVKSDSFRAAMATLVESLLIVALFIFLGIIIAYLVYIIHGRFRRGAKSDPVSSLFGNPSADPDSPGRTDDAEIGFNPDEKPGPQPHS